MQNLAFGKHLPSLRHFAFLAAVTLIYGCGDNQSVTSTFPADAPSAPVDASLQDGPRAIDGSPSSIDGASVGADAGIDATPTQVDASVPAPSIASIAPSFGSPGGGTTVTIFGSNLTGVTVVTFGGVAATSLTVVSDVDITVVTPAHDAGAVDVVVTTPGGSATDAAAFTFGLPPSILSLDPATGPATGGTLVTITGSAFTGSTEVQFGSIDAQFTVVDDDTIAATTPLGIGVVDVTVTTPLGSTTDNNAFTYN